MHGAFSTDFLAGVINEQDCRAIRTVCCCLNSLRIRGAVVSRQLQLMLASVQPHPTEDLNTADTSCRPELLLKISIIELAPVKRIERSQARTNASALATSVHSIALNQFFSLSVADVALKARSLHERKQKKTFVQGHKSIGASKSIKPTHNHKNQQNTTTRKSPSQTCVSPAEKQSKQQNTKTAENGARAQTEHPQNRFAIRRSGGLLNTPCSPTAMLGQCEMDWSCHMLLYSAPQQHCHRRCRGSALPAQKLSG